MAGNRRGRMNKGPRHAQTVRFPLEHFEYYAKQAQALRIPVGDFVAYRIAVCEDLKIPGAVIMAHPGLLDLLPAHRREEALRENPGLAARYEALIGAADSTQLEMQVA
ncbi:hypothetical protein ACNTMW_31090 [Planosporangium sp. 12N6]|uniref:hypothetical protein n=1 Tax=Planosporangium spinosum TaxID=3402278 RepID=UPI003CF90173